jgi:hypothetical protein
MRAISYLIFKEEIVMLNIQRKTKKVLTYPPLSLIMGVAKVGKSCKCAELQNTLVLDLEQRGYDHLDVEAKIKVENLGVLKEALKVFFEGDEFDNLVIDHIRCLTNFFAETITSSNNVKFIQEISYGKGIGELKQDIESFFKYVIRNLAKHPSKRVVIVGHAINKNGEVRLDIDGKNEELVMSLVDAIGYVDRDPISGQTNINFNYQSGCEFGCRNPNLSKYNGPFDWIELFKVAQTGE